MLTPIDIENKLLWPEEYENHICRNIGYFTRDEQQKVRTTRIAVLGTGGLGGPLAEQLIRSGSENLVICDRDTFESSNLNRQVCNRKDIGLNKTSVIRNLLEDINPSAKITVYHEVDRFNVSFMLEGVEFVALTLDDPIASILIARECRKKEIPLLETWALPYLCAWWFTSKSIDYETCYGLDTHYLSSEELEHLDRAQMNLLEALIPKLLKFPGLTEIWDREPGALEKVLSGKMPARCIAPVVRLNASYLAFELLFAGILNVKPKIQAPHVIGYDYFRMRRIHFNL